MCVSVLCVYLRACMCVYIHESKHTPFCRIPCVPDVAEDGGVRLLTNGSISAAVHWERDDSGRVLCPPVPNATLLSNTGR